MHDSYNGLCCLGLGSAKGELWHTTLGRLMFRVSTRRWLRLGIRRAPFYKANAVELGPFIFYWRDNR